MKGTIVGTVLLFSFIYFVSAQIDYCTLCSSHIACNNSGDYALTCQTDRTIVPLTLANQQELIKIHNDYRNQIAGGLIPGYKSASKMKKIVIWDPELAYFAELNVKRCGGGHDKCRSTELYPMAGQNLFGTSGTYSKYPNITDVIKSATSAFFNEYKTNTQAAIDKCCGTAGHLTQMVQEDLIAIGCAVLRYMNVGKRNTLLCCNYSIGNYGGGVVYTSGNPGSACTNGRDLVHTNLCK